MTYLCGGNTHHRERGRKPLSQARFNTKRGENQGFLPTLDVESDPRFLPQICLLIHGATFFARLLREPQCARQKTVRGCMSKRETRHTLAVSPVQTEQTSEASGEEKPSETGRK